MGREEEDEEEDIVILEGEDGEEIAFQVLAVVEVDGQDYALLVEIDDDGELPEEFDVHVFRYKARTGPSSTTTWTRRRSRRCAKPPPSCSTNPTPNRCVHRSTSRRTWTRRCPRS